MYLLRLFLLHKFKRSRARSYDVAERWLRSSPSSLQHRAVVALMESDKCFRDEMTMRQHVREQEALGRRMKRIAEDNRRRYMASRCLEPACFYDARESGYCRGHESIMNIYNITPPQRLEGA